MAISRAEGKGLSEMEDSDFVNLKKPGPRRMLRAQRAAAGAKPEARAGADGSIRRDV